MAVSLGNGNLLATLDGKANIGPPDASAGLATPAAARKRDTLLACFAALR
jgi:hypothetical protein